MNCQRDIWKLQQKVKEEEEDQQDVGIGHSKLTGLKQERQQWSSGYRSFMLLRNDVQAKDRLKMIWDRGGWHELSPLTYCLPVPITAIGFPLVLLVSFGDQSQVLSKN